MSIPLASADIPGICWAGRRDGTAPRQKLPKSGGEMHMPAQMESRPQECTAPNAILDRMRRRIARVGLLVAFVSSLLTAVLIFVVCACATML
jgi:hypothetical protein